MLCGSLFHGEGNEVLLGAGIGIAIYPQDAVDPPRLATGGG